MTEAIISTGSTFRLYGAAVQTHPALPAGTFKVRFSSMQGYSLEKVPDMVTVPERVHGVHPTRVPCASG